MPKDKHKKADRKKKAGKKSAQLAIRIEKSERDAFVTLCEAQDTSAAREIRRFMRDYVAAHSAPTEAAPSDTPDEGEAQPVGAPATTVGKPARRPRAAKAAPPAAIESAPAEAAPKPRKPRVPKPPAPASEAEASPAPKRRAPRQGAATPA
jgi:hypothetical protein